jgi:zinc finger-containing ubiquitin peptidase 1
MLARVLRVLRKDDNRERHCCGEFDWFRVQRGADSGWGCGYRNVQVLVSYALRCSGAALRQSMCGGTMMVPSVADVQTAIDEAHRLGFDSAKRAHERVFGTRRWIGTADVASMLLAMRVPAEVFSFERHDTRGHEALVNWARFHFDESARGAAAPPPSPLYLQHDGHSRTVIGVECSSAAERHRWHLLVVDPYLSESFVRFSAHARNANFRFDAARLAEHALYQVVRVDPSYQLSPDEMHRRKVLLVTKIRHRPSIDDDHQVKRQRH